MSINDIPRELISRFRKDESHCFAVRGVPVAVGYPGGKNY